MSNDDDYEYDFFLSYPVNSDAGTWVRNHFLPVLRAELQNEAPNPTLFCWLENETGVLWEPKLKQAHARSKIMVAVLTPPYFYKSQWCPIEWHTMFKRQELAQLATRSDGTDSLIYPVLFSDGPSLPNYAHQVTCKDFRAWAFPEPQFKDTNKYLEFREAVRELAQELVHRRLPLAPPWSADWPAIEVPPLRAPRAAKPEL